MSPLHPIPLPPRARLCFRIGVVGHRPDRLPADHEQLELLRETLRAVLLAAKSALATAESTSEVARLYSEMPAVLRAISALAEGSDRIFAEEALEVGAELFCPLPFAQAEYENDFATVESHAQFRALLGRSQGSFALDGDRMDAGTAYGAAGRIVLNQSDLLVAVWDGGAPAGPGGTVDTIEEALRFHVPVLWIDAKDPVCWRVLRFVSDLPIGIGGAPAVRPEQALGDSGQQHRAMAEAVAAVVREEITLPAQSAIAPEGGATHRGIERATHSRAQDYFAERQPSFNLCIWWKLFRDVVAEHKLRMPSIRVPDFEQSARIEWPCRDELDHGGTETSSLADWLNRRLRAHFAWPDGRANIYADAYRSAYILSYLFSALAVGVAVLPLAAELKESGARWWIGSELLLLTVVVVLLWLGHRRHWHDRWMEYRLLAELVRQLRLLVPLGGGRPVPRVPAQLAVYGDPKQTWMYWQMRAISREIGLPSARVDTAYVRDCLDVLDEVVGSPERGQWFFHLAAEERSKRLSHRLHGVSFFLFFAVLVGVVIHFGAAFLSKHIFEQVDPWLVFASAWLPALAAALAAINNQGEFTRLAKRSAAMASGFQRFSEEVAALRADPHLKLAKAIPLASRIAAAMVEEVVDWRVVFIDRPQDV